MALLRYKKYLKKDNSPNKRFTQYFTQKKVRYRKGTWTWTYLQTFVLPKGYEYLKGMFQKGKLA